VNDARRRLLERRIIGQDRRGRPVYAIAGGSVDADTTTDAKPDPALPYTLEDLRGKTPEELHRIVVQLDERLRALHQTPEGELRVLEDHEKRAMTLGLQIRAQALAMLEEHNQIAEVFRTKPKAVQGALANLIGTDTDPLGSIRALSSAEARDRALRVLDSDRTGTMHLAADQKEQIERNLRRNSTLARRILVTENEDYRTAWMKVVTDPHPILSDDERHAMQAWGEFRAMADFTTTAGGFGIPVFIDPSIILTAQGSGNPFLAISRVVDINTTVWKGVSSAGVTWAFQTEGAVTTDNSPTLAQPSVAVHMARGFIPFSIEVQSDYPSFASEMSTLLAEGYDELLVDKFTRGSGSGEPKGILTAISATAGSRVVVTTGGTIGAPDPYKLWQALPQRFRRNAAWLMSVGVNNAIRQIGAANVFHGYTVNLPEGWADQLFNSAVYESPYMPGTTTWSTTAEGQAIVGDFSNFVIARNGGMSVELVPTLFQQQTAGTGVGFPTGQRGWFAYARIGSDVANAGAFRLLAHS
jgi:HK97 family phage major capsid protein